MVRIRNAVGVLANAAQKQVPNARHAIADQGRLLKLCEKECDATRTRKNVKGGGTWSNTEQ